MFKTHRTVNQILEAFRRTIDELDGVALQQIDKAAEKSAVINEAMQERAAAMTESKRATTVADKLRQIFE